MSDSIKILKEAVLTLIDYAVGDEYRRDKLEEAQKAVNSISTEPIEVPSAKKAKSKK